MTRHFFNITLLIGLILLFSACSNSQVTSVLEDISRDTYEKKMQEQRFENREDPTYQPPPTYDRYQREIREMRSDPLHMQPTPQDERQLVQTTYRLPRNRYNHDVKVPDSFYHKDSAYPC